MDSLVERHISEWPQAQTTLKFYPGEDQAYTLIEKGEPVFLVFSRKGHLFAKAKGGRVRPFGYMDSWIGQDTILANQAGVWVCIANLKEEGDVPAVTVESLDLLAHEDLAAADFWIRQESVPKVGGPVDALRANAGCMFAAVLLGAGLLAGAQFGKPLLDKALEETTHQLSKIPFESF